MSVQIRGLNKVVFVTSIHLFLILYFCLVSKTNVYANTVLFSDDFESDTIGGFPSEWKFLRSVQWANPSLKCKNGINDAEWEIVEHNNSKMAFIQIQGPSCVYEIIPHYFEISDHSNYEYQIDVYLDDSEFKPRNIAYRHLNGGNTYSLKILPPQLVELQKSVNHISYPNHHGSFIYNDQFSSNTKYTFNIRVQNNFITYTINGEQSYSILDINPILSQGTIALQASSSNSNPTAVYFDNIIVTSLVPEDDLDVIHFSQRDPQWKDETYDHNDQEPLTIYNPAGSREIEEWGCALTSAAMLLDYHGFNLTPSGNPLNPSTLNQYLISNHGYNKYGGVMWNGISKFASDSKNAGYTDPDHYLLEFKYDPFDYNTLATDIENELPNIIKVVTNDKNTPIQNDDNLHFVVATNIDTDDNNKITINDPWDLSQTTEPLQTKYAGKEYRQLARYIPSYTDLSYLWIYQYNPNVDMLVEHDGLLTGTDGINSYQQIPDAQYFEDGAISPPEINPQISLYPESITQKTFVHPKPNPGTYFIHLIPKISGFLSDVEIFTYDTEANLSAHQFNKALTDQPIMIKLMLYPDENIQSILYEDQVSIGYEYLFTLLEKYHNQGAFTDEEVYDSLRNQLEVSQKMLGKKDLSLKLIEKPFQQHMEKLYGEGRISLSAYDSLDYHTNNLKHFLQ